MALLHLASLPWLFTIFQICSSTQYQNETSHEIIIQSGWYGKALDGQDTFIQGNNNCEEVSNGHDVYSTSLRGASNKTLSCKEDLGGSGSFDSVCELDRSVYLEDDSYIKGKGSLILATNVSISCPYRGCIIEINVSGEVFMKSDSSIVAGTIIVDARSVQMAKWSSMNTTALAGPPPSQTSGTPHGLDGAGGGYGGRGAFCVDGDSKDQEDAWGGDVYSWSSLATPWSYGSQGGTTSKEEDLGGGGGGRVFISSKWLNLNGRILADGGSADVSGGGGSGGSIQIRASVL
jgi:hypothetical protein